MSSKSSWITRVLGRWIQNETHAKKTCKKEGKKKGREERKGGKEREGEGGRERKNKRRKNKQKSTVVYLR